MTKTLDGKASGLQNAKSLKAENEKFRDRQKKIFDSMGADVSGKNADVVIRDRRGRNKEFEFDLEKERKKMEAEEARKKVYDKWSKGLKQVEAAEERRREFEHEASKPLARAENDQDLQDYLKNQERLDDPMLLYMRKKKNEEKKSKGVLEKPLYQGDFPDNRFGIRPGFRWDGVDRSNGYEKKFFSVISAKKSLEEEAYRYSTEDM
jgi:pre-mRNA-splicing factor CWC26